MQHHACHRAVHVIQNNPSSTLNEFSVFVIRDGEKFTQMKQTTDRMFFFYFGLRLSPTLKARQCELMAPVPPSQSALSRQQWNRLRLKTNICTSLWALSLFSHIIFNSFQVIWTGWCPNTKPVHGWKTKEWCQPSFILSPFSQHYLLSKHK